MESAGQSTAPEFACEESALRAAFCQCSEEARGSLEKLQLAVGEHVLREDVPEVLSRALGRQLSGKELAALLKCFLLDISAAMSWGEFERSWQALQALLTSRTGAAQAGVRGRATAVAAAKAAAQQHAAVSCEPRTAQAEIGWQHAAAPLPGRQRCEEPANRYVPLRGTDVTYGSQGRSAATYFGMYLS